METTTTTNGVKKHCYSDFLTILERQPQLYDLHTHLLGMGNVGFWIDTILSDEKIMPTNKMFFECGTTRRNLCRLIWNKVEDENNVENENKFGFINGDRTAEFIELLTHREQKNRFPWDDSETKREVQQLLKNRFDKLFPTFWNLFKDETLQDDEKFNEELRHRGLNFNEHFSYDVVLVIRDLANGLGIGNSDDQDIAQMKIADKLGIYLSHDTKSIQFRHYIVFNARLQKFEIVYGLRVEDLRNLIRIDADAPNEAKKIARAHIINAFSMCDAQGTPARHVDLHNFRGAFTPEFYPRRFVLKDSIYSQRLDVLASLLSYVLKRYQLCLPPVKYCEFSLGVGDLSRAWVFDVLCSFPSREHLEAIKTRSEPLHGTSDVMNGSSERLTTTCVPDGQCTPVESNYTYVANEKKSSFAQCVHDKHFPYLEVTCRMTSNPKDAVPSTPDVMYKFLVGFDRANVDISLLKNENDVSNVTNVNLSVLEKQHNALHFLNDFPQAAILLMLEEIKNSQNGVTTSKLFAGNLEKLRQLQKNTENILWFYDWVVGIDLFGDELGYPYCPFVAYQFITYVEEIRKREKYGTRTNEKYSHFGVRFHCGENVHYVDDESPAYRSFVAHMYIIFCCLQFLRYKLDYNIRIGHGIAFERILGDTMNSSLHRKSSTLIAEMRHQAPKLFENIAFEVNITSNEYLLGDNLRQGNIIRTHCLEALLKLGAPIILATDDDGIWPIDQCSSSHPGHHSLAAEYCRAISSSLFADPDELKKVLLNSKNFCFFDMKGVLQKSLYNLPRNVNSRNAIILHPELVKHILRRLKALKRLQEINELKNELLTAIRAGCPGNEEYTQKLRKIRGLLKAQETEKNQARLFQQPADALSRKAHSHGLKKEKTDYLNAIRQSIKKQNHLLNGIYGLTPEHIQYGPFYSDYGPSYPNIPDDYTIEDEIMWKEYEVIARVAYVCSCIKDPSVDEYQVDIDEEYHILFQGDKDGRIFKYIYRCWKSIHDNFMKSDDNNPTSYSYVLIEPPEFLSNSTADHEHVFMSPIHRRNKNFDENFGIEFACDQQRRSMEIRIYPGNVNIDHAIHKWQYTLSRDGLKHLSMIMYTNNDKHKFRYIKSGDLLRLKVNPRSAIRDKTKKQFLYALCPHAAAATAALHFIADSFHSSIAQSIVVKRDVGSPPDMIPVKKSQTSQEASGHGPPTDLKVEDQNTSNDSINKAIEKSSINSLSENTG